MQSVCSSIVVVSVNAVRLSIGENMRMLILILSLLAMALSAPPTDEYTKVIYSGDHDIIKIVVPVNRINEKVGDVTFFFVEADLTNPIDYKGLYVSINGTVTKLLEDGTDVTATFDNTFKAFFASKQGIYVYNHDENKAEKYGDFNEEIIGIANEKGTDVLYVLTKDKKVHKITDEGKKKIETEHSNIDQIMLDYSNNFYYRIGKEPYVVTKDGVKKVVGLPKNPKHVELAKHIMAINEGVLFISDDKIFGIEPNGTVSEFHLSDWTVTPTAVSVEALLINYYAYDKKIYSTNIAEAIMSEIVLAIKDFFGSFRT